MKNGKEYIKNTTSAYQSCDINSVDHAKASCRNLKPSGWIEQVELDVRVMSDDGAHPKDGYLAGWGDDFLGCAERSGRCLDTQITMKEVIDKAGFTDIQERLYKCPIGGWPKGVVLKEAGKFNKAPSRTCGSFYYPPSPPRSRTSSKHSQKTHMTGLLHK